MNLKKTLNENSKLLTIFIIVVLIVILISLYSQTSSSDHLQVLPTPSEESELLEVQIEGKDVVFKLEKAEDQTEWATGLMNRSQMAPLRGMIFIFPDSEIRSFWMRNTYIPLDMIFVDQNKRVINIEKNAEPLNEGPRYTSSSPAKYVIELNAGITSEYDIVSGDQLVFKIFE